MAAYKFNSVEVIESLKESDGNPGRELVDFWNADPTRLIPMRYHFVADRAHFFEVLETIRSKMPNQIPVLHFELHGNDEEFALRSDERIKWEEFGPYLRRINVESCFNLLVAFSCCFGIHQIAAMSAYKASPFACVVGCNASVQTDELLAGFKMFYSTLGAKNDAGAALDSLQSCIKTGATFSLLDAENMFRQVYAKIRTANTGDKYWRKNKERSIRLEVQEEAKRQRKPNGRLTLWQIHNAIRSAEANQLSKFYDSFFACDEIPSNRSRFPFAEMAKGL